MHTTVEFRPGDDFSTNLFADVNWLTGLHTQLENELANKKCRCYNS